MRASAAEAAWAERCIRDSVDDGAGGYAQVAVETGLSDGMYVEITSGVAAGDTVYVQTGTQSVESRLSLQNLYKSLFGEKTVVNDRTGGAGGFGGGMELPEGMEMPEGFEPSSGMPSFGGQSGAPPATESGDLEGGTDDAQ